jgi:hypothetical protein
MKIATVVAPSTSDGQLSREHENSLISLSLATRHVTTRSKRHDYSACPDAVYTTPPRCPELGSCNRCLSFDSANLLPSRPCQHAGLPESDMSTKIEKILSSSLFALVNNDD